MKPKIHLFIILFLNTIAFAQPSVVNTSGDNSPAVIAQNFSVTYGVRADAVEAILWIYEAEGYDVNRRKRATEQILREYAQSPEKQQNAGELSEATRRRMGLADAPKVANALEWDLFARNHYLSTSGYNSPAVVAKGDVNIWYGIPPKALRALATQLEKNKTDFANFETQLAEQVKKYEELKTELETYGSKEEIYRQAEALLEEGKLEEAEQLIESDFDASMKRQAYKGYVYGKTKELLLKYEEASKGYKNAINNDEGNTTYHLYYANNETTLAHYDEAIRHFEIALGIDSLKNGNKEKTATLLNKLGEAWALKGEYDKAIDYYEKVLQIDLKAFGENHFNFVRAYNNLGEACLAKGNYDNAIVYFEKVLQSLLEALGDNHLNVAMVYNNLGGAWSAKGEYDKAIKYHEKALKIGLQAFGDNHPNVATGYNNLGEAWRGKEEYGKAIHYYEKALKIGLQAFGDNHPNVATGYNNLGEAWRGKEEYDKAIHYYEKALKIFLQAIGENHSSVATLHNNLGVAWTSKGEYDKAITYYEKALPIDLETFGENHPNVAREYNNLGSAWDLKGEYDKAVAYFEKCQAIFDRFFEPTHPNQKRVAKNLSRTASSRGMELFSEKKYQEALGYFQKSLKNAQKAGDDVFSITCLNNIGSMQKHLEKYEEGLQSLEEGIKKAAELKNLRLIRRMQYHKVGCLKGLNRNKEADALTKQLWQEGMEAQDTRLLEDLRKEGYDFGGN